MKDITYESQVHNEYNPARPNDYEEYCMERSHTPPSLTLPGTHTSLAVHCVNN
jgi:hypothetical protein